MILVQELTIVQQKTNRKSSAAVVSHHRQLGICSSSEHEDHFKIVRERERERDRDLQNRHRWSCLPQNNENRKQKHWIRWEMVRICIRASMERKNETDRATERETALQGYHRWSFLRKQWGITKTEKENHEVRGEMVRILYPGSHGKSWARLLVAYSSAKTDQIRNSLSADLKTLLPVQLQINAKIYIKKKKTK